MKFKFTGGAFILLTILSSACSNEEVGKDIDLTPPQTLAPSGSAQLNGIRNYIASNKIGTKGKDADIRPYIDEDGDTLMYIADYGDGWELFSNSLTAPMSLIKSDTGNFDSALETTNPVFAEIFDNLTAALKADKQNPELEYQDGAEQWIPYVSAPIPKPDPGSDKTKTLVGTKINPDEDIHIYHLLNTKWGQGNPYNKYMPKDDTNKDSEGHIFVGCTVVATGQLMYYCHYMWGNPSLTPSNATYNESTNKYEFTQFSSAGWDKMLRVNYFKEPDPYTAMLLGWIAKNIDAKPSYKDGVHSGTGAWLSKAADFFKQETGYTTSVKNYDRSAISSMMKKNRPVPLWLYGDDGGHVVVIDAMDYHAKSGINYYAYVSSGGGTTTPNPTPGPPNTSTDPEYDALVAQYGEIAVEPYHTSTSYFRFNWGYYGSGDDDYYINGDVIPLIYHDKTGDISYNLYQYMYYDIN